jgi:chitodextrinase
VSYSYQVRAIDAAGNQSGLSAPATVVVTGPADTQPPTAPGNLSATPVSTSQVNLSWTASSDDVRVTGYRVSRNGTLLQSLSGNATSYSDDTAQPATTYTYTVAAFDATGNTSAASAATVTTPPSGGGVLTFSPSDDATIDAANPTVNAGTSSRITVDTSPVNDLLLKFTVSGTGAGTSCPSITAAKLRLTVGNNTNDNSNMGGVFRGAANSSWAEGTVTWNTAPAASGTPVAAITTPVALNTAYLVDVTPLVGGNGSFTIRASGNSSDGARYYSRNGNPASMAPQLQITCG